MSRKPDGDDWARYTSDVRPLGRRKRPVATAPIPEPVPRPPAITAAAALPSSSRPAPTRELESGAAVDLDRRTMDRLARGRLRPEATLDLHGLTLPAAHRALGAFLARAQARGTRSVLVITGRGKLGEGAIRAELPRWLNAPELRPRVLGFAVAQPRDGGAGAVYVLLRRLR
jgi:DNA-nicking Smr family endonuclease